MNVIIPAKNIEQSELDLLTNLIFKNIQAYHIKVILEKSEMKHLTAPKGVHFVDEDKIIPGLSKEKVISACQSRNIPKERSGWYFQQFIKIGYSLTAQEEYYLVWDSDHYPLRPLKFFNGGQPLFVRKHEFHPPYFLTIERLLGISINPDERWGSFIAECMIFKTPFAKSLISVLEKHNSSHAWWENILDAIHPEHRQISGFSEFETYGTYVRKSFPDTYGEKKLKTFRLAHLLVGSTLNCEISRWLSKDFDSIVIERKPTLINLSWLAKVGLIRSCVSATKFKTILEFARSLNARLQNKKRVKYD